MAPKTTSRHAQGTPPSCWLARCTASTPLECTPPLNQLHSPSWGASSVVCVARQYQHTTLRYVAWRIGWGIVGHWGTVGALLWGTGETTSPATHLLKSLPLPTHAGYHTTSTCACISTCACTCACTCGCTCAYTCACTWTCTCSYNPFARHACWIAHSIAVQAGNSGVLSGLVLGLIRTGLYFVPPALI